MDFFVKLFTSNSCLSAFEKKVKKYNLLLNVWYKILNIPAIRICLFYNNTNLQLVYANVSTMNLMCYRYFNFYLVEMRKYYFEGLTFKNQAEKKTEFELQMEVLFEKSASALKKRDIINAWISFILWDKVEFIRILMDHPSERQVVKNVTNVDLKMIEKLTRDKCFEDYRKNYDKMYRNAMIDEVIEEFKVVKNYFMENIYKGERRNVYEPSNQDYQFRPDFDELNLLNLLKPKPKPKPKYDDCVICLEEIEEKDAKVLGCRHVLHKKCFDDLTQSGLMSHMKCPVCRADI